MANTRTVFALFLGGEICLGFGLLFWQLAGWNCENWPRFIAFAAVALYSSRLKIRMPNLVATLTPSFIAVFIAGIELSTPEAVVISVASGVFQSVVKIRQARLDQVAFNAALTAIGSLCFVGGYRLSAEHIPVVGVPIGLVVGSALYFGLNTLTVARIATLEAGTPFVENWKLNYMWSFPYYLGGGALAGMVAAASDKMGWQFLLILMPVAYLFYNSYNTYMGRISDSKKHVEEVAALHLRTIESLALAIEAKDDTTHAHLRRVQTYALAIGEELGMKGGDLEALRAAAILHDIGKLAVPEHIICKPGKLTPEEFEKMKIHPVVGAEILEHVKFPYPVAPIVRAHHEKWNGMGYPYGLRGEEIPLGARILAAVDCLDALASDRQYRRALPLDEAMKVVEAETSRSFDPRVVEVLQRRYKELEKAAVASCVDTVKLSKDIRIERGLAPAAGFESSGPAQGSTTAGAAGGAQQPEQAVDETVAFLNSIASARREVQELFELSQELGNSLSLAETLSLFTSRLKRMIPHDAMALYIQKANTLEAEYVQGENGRLFQSLRIPLGEGLAGWVAQHQRPIINGNPAVEPGYLNDPTKFTNLRSALAIPLTGVNGFVGVLALYHQDKDAFRRDHLRILQAITSKLAVSVENSRKFEASESRQGTDTLTGLPNLKSMFVRFDAELARSKRTGAPLGVLVCDINGFKSMNDRLGHNTGDRLLQGLARGLREIFREYDMVSRLGGDEFVIILPEMAKEAVQVKVRQMEDLAARVGEEVLGPSPDAQVQISVGEAAYPDDGATVEGLLSEADRRMYLAKRRPRLVRTPQTAPAAAAASAPVAAPVTATPAAAPAPVRIPPAAAQATPLAETANSRI